MRETSRRPSNYHLAIEFRLNDQAQWPSLEAYAVSYLKDRFNHGPVGWFTDEAVERIYLTLCFNRDGTTNSRYTALKALYELWIHQRHESDGSIKVH